MTTVNTSDRIDWLAVEFVCNGTPMRLTYDPPTLHAAILAMGYSDTVDVIAERLGTTIRQVQRIIKKNGGEHCPACKRLLLLPDGDTIPHHVNPLAELCRMGGHSIGDRALLAQIRWDQRRLGNLR